MVDPFENIVTDAHIDSVADAIREVIMIPDGMTIVEMPEKIRLAMQAEVDGGLFTDWEPEEEVEIFDAGELNEDDHLVFDTKRFRRKENGEKNTD